MTAPLGGQEGRTSEADIAVLSASTVGQGPNRATHNCTSAIPETLPAISRGSLDQVQLFVRRERLRWHHNCVLVHRELRRGDRGRKSRSAASTQHGEDDQRPSHAAMLAPLRVPIRLHVCRAEGHSRTSPADHRRDPSRRPSAVSSGRQPARRPKPLFSPDFRLA